MKKIPQPTPAQQQFIDCTDRSILLHACVGTGKTYALALRTVKAIERGINPERILCVTFTNRAAEEMRQRISLYCPEHSRKVVTRTFHGLCAWILRLEARTLGIPQDFVIMDEDDSQEIIGQLKLGDLHYGLAPKDVYNALQAFKTDKRVIRIEDKPPLNRELLVKMERLYQQELAGLRGLDFGDLIKITHKALAPGGALAAKWRHRFDLIQVDEMQDTHIKEYEIIAALAKKSQNLVLAGDFDQTIYEWRGSTPDVVIYRFKRDFPNYEDMTFLENHRSARVLIEAARSVVASYSKELPKPAAAAPAGGTITAQGAADEYHEALWVAERVKQLNKQGIPYSRIGVLCRTNNRAGYISQAMEQQGVPHLTVETYEFFRRQEVKDALAYLKLLLNPDDRLSLIRMLRRPTRGIGEQSIKKIESHADSGLRLTDMVSLDTIMTGDPFGVLLLAVKSGTIVIFDCETTGLDPAQDEIIELAAVKLHKGQIVDRFHKYLKPGKPVGQSVYVHGLTDQFLARRGEDAQTVLREFVDFVENGVLVGHNIGFDIRMVESAGKRYGVNFTAEFWYDTLTLAKRYIDTDSYKLGDLAAKLGFSHRPTHRADDDIAATAELLWYLLPKLREGRSKRQQVVKEFKQLFIPLAEQVNSWRNKMRSLQPSQLLYRVLEESGLLAYYQSEPKRMKNLMELIDTARQFDSFEQHPTASLQALINFSALARNIDRLDNSSSVTVITVHQAKGLEFDVVFMAGLSEYEFPNYGATKEGREREELRLFYVGITRAKTHLFLSWYEAKNGRYRNPSPYLKLLPQQPPSRIHYRR